MQAPYNDLEETRFILLRHAPTEWNETKTIQGATDTDLSKAGTKLAKGWLESSFIPLFERILCSDLKRAVETAEILNTVMLAPVDVDARLREQDWGSWAGKTLEQIQEQYQDELDAETKKGWGFRPLDGESRSEVRDRAIAALNDAAMQWKGERILVVSHLGVIKAVLNHLQGTAMLPDNVLKIRKNTFHEIVHGPDGLRVDQYNIPIG